MFHRPWTLFTYMFTHYSFFHLLFNMLWLYWFADFFLTLGKGHQLIILYIYGGVLGGILYLIVCNLPFAILNDGLLSGASASTLSIVVATAWLTPNMKIQLFLFGEIAIKWLAIAAVFISILALSGNNFGGNVAHLGGVLAGAAFAIAFKSGLDITRFHWRKTPLRFKFIKREYLTNDNDDAAALNALLDKVRRSGYNSLNSAERKKLLELSNKL